MSYQFTSAAERALNHASNWLDPAGPFEIDPLSLLLGLLTESECRAAHLLNEHGVLMQGVCDKWGLLGKSASNSPSSFDTSYPFNYSLNRAVRQVYQFALDFERKPILATEHLLLALLYSEGEISSWLNERGATAEALEEEIRTRSGYVNTPLDVEMEDEETGDDYCKLDIANCKMQIEQSDLLGGGDQRISPPFAFRLPPSSSSLLRILDAAGNRAREGLRVVEDFLRFVLDDRFLTETAKQLRHDLVAALKRLPATERLASRETQADVGTGLTTAAETVRADLTDVLAANFGRLEESLRSLEEYGKLVDAGMASEFKQIRYRIYTLERAVEITRQNSERLAAARLYVLIDGRGALDDFSTLVSSLVAAGVHVLQLRDKKLDDRQLLERARALRQLTQGTPTLFIMNDRPDLAVLSQADGVHLGQEELTVKDARSIVGPQMMIGVSTHSIEQARQAVLDGASYIGVGPTFPSATKEFAVFPGLELLRQVAAEIRLPAFAIGGLTPENLAEVLATGISRIAVSGSIANDADALQAAKMFLGRLE